MQQSNVFNDSVFRAVITNETNGYYLDDGINFTDENGKEYIKNIGLDRYDNKDIGNSVFEFYNVFDIEEKELYIKIEVYDNYEIFLARDNINVNIK